MATYYEPLDVDFYEIRMLSILPATTHDAVVKCTLEKTSLLGPPKYVALSYCWGDPNFTTTIFVNDIEVNVTVNLADALKHLRLLEVTRVWEDALCINQSDRQERSLQIRHMKHIYSKADDTYSWLGRNDADSSKTAMRFLQKLLLAEDGALPTDLSNVHSPAVNGEALQPTTMPIISEVLAPTSIEEDIAIADAGERRLLETLCRPLQDFFQRPYWKRRWIIQEIAVSPRVQISCDDPRDRIFALLSLCHDGPELVPTPNYRQPLVLVVADISKALLRKKKYCEVVLINRLLETGSNPGPLSLWISDEATKDVAESGYSFLNKQLDSMGKLCMLETSREISLFLQVEGAVIGTIVAATSILGSGGGSNSDRITSGSLEEMLLTDQSTQPTAYYASSAEIAAAITSCLTQRYAGASWYLYRNFPSTAQWFETHTQGFFSVDIVLHASVDMKYRA
ncbi:Heterokaryon incompatibility protein 6,OR allele [Lachnellula hyalina]|uniref:Heterokaryon incompatibility protein 6,OR allele n=1 Tax=Lachnellula hyalina TaxID=1316788 RepID=A0A8H8R2E6_9HELO|nr:Heterokaryon incompatibility protein 6,OR allele [Lachnellula hyalina]TVY26821.1 Heterokaryon incompatibility protein 6,OR allele [Lachnellula hyalina]